MKKNNTRKNKNTANRPRPQKTSFSEKTTEKTLRLNKYLANAGICSRREADELIKNGLITVNGKTITELGTKVTKKDTVKYKNKIIGFEKNVYILLNKPKGVLTTVSDDRGRKTVIDIIGNKIPERIYPVGRLDKDSTGILLLTNDGNLTKKLTHPKYNKKKIYHVFLDKNLKKSDAEKLAKGIELEDGFMKFDAVAYPDPENKKDVGVEIHSGRNRIIRRMFAALGYEVLKLDRVYFAGLTKKNLKRGKWRFLTEKEISMLKRGNSE
ncbi:MAG: rRNA pseudouridine synthase [Chlorobi bacterium]|nr:rRNA pseudouridine synthase [Chlorobiota bacterium]